MRPLAPGAVVCHREFDKSSNGMVISVVDGIATVLWTSEPEEIDIDFSKLAAPLSRRLNYSNVAQQMLKVEHMPSGAHAIYAKDDEE